MTLGHMVAGLCASGLRGRESYFDFQKDFDSVPHDKLMTKLQSLGLEKQLLAVVADFLSERTFSVTVGNSSSVPRHVLSGVPQGSV